MDRVGSKTFDSELLMAVGNRINGILIPTSVPYVPMAVSLSKPYLIRNVGIIIASILCINDRSMRVKEIGMAR